MKKYLRKVLPETHPVRLLFHRLKAMLAVVLYWFPSDKMIVIGVTGTNGKTTTVNLLTNILKGTGHKVGMASTINFVLGDKAWTNNTNKTTLGPFAFQKLLRQMVKNGCKYAVLEVSSHAVTQSRVYGVNFDMAVVTNVTPEHIEYHGNFDSYLNAKGQLFKNVSNSRRKFGVAKVLISNVDDKYFDYFGQFVADRKMNYGLKSATIYAENVEKRPDGSSFILHVPNSAIPIDLKMPGEFNVYNALAAASCAIALQVPIEKIKSGLEDSVVVAGRFESVDCGQKYGVIVDFAHTPDALENLFAMYRKLTKGRLFVVFGATGGGRDKARRPGMGKIANDNADYIILTNDDPYYESELGIIDQLAEGISRDEGKDFWKIPDRREAIRLALTLAKEDDTVLISGKGAQEYLYLKGKAIPFNDKKVVEELLDREVEVELFRDEWVKRPNVRLES